MSWRDCIQDAIDTGRISAGRGAQAQQAYDAAFSKAQAEGMDAGSAEMFAADKAIEDITSLNKAKRWARIKEMQVAKKQYDRLMGSNAPWRELEQIAEDLENGEDNASGWLFANLDNFMEKFAPKKGGIQSEIEGMDEVVEAAFGGSASPEAKAMADALKEMEDLAIKLANDEGASITPNPKRHLAQMQDGVKVSSHSETEWVNDHISRVDLTVMRYKGKVIDPADLPDILARTYRGIRSNGADRGLEAQGATQSLVSRMNDSRFIYYKDAASHIEMMKKYGSGNLFEQTIGYVENMAKDISMLRHLGPNPNSMKEFVKRVALKRASDMDGAAGKNQQKFLNKMERQVKVFDREYEIHSRDVPAITNPFALAIGSIRTLSVNALLGSVVIPSLGGDIANMKAARAMFGLPISGVLRSYTKQLAGGMVSKKQAARSGIIWQSAISQAHSRMRYFGAMDGPAVVRKVSDVTYRLGTAAAHTQISRNATGMDLLGIFQDNANLRFDDTPFAHVMTERGITPKDWDVFRNGPVHDADGLSIIRPLDLYEVDPDVAHKFGEFLQLYVRTAVPDVTLRARSALGETMDPNTFMGQFVRTVTSLASFPTTIYFNQLRRIANAPNARDKLALGAMYFTFMTMGGMFITQAKAFVAGQNLYDMDPTNLWEDPAKFLDFYGRSVINGGSLGILGDLVFNNLNVANSGYRPGSPTEEYLKSLKDLTLGNAFQAAQGEDMQVSKDALKFLDKNVPNFWQTKLLFDRAVADDLMQQVDPKGYARKRKYEQEHEEGYWWGQGDEAEAPELETVIGG